MRRRPCYGVGVTAAPETGFLTRYLLENPWPLGALLAVAAIILGKVAMDRDDRRLLAAAGGCVAAAAALFLVAWLVTTPGEHAKRVTRELVAAAEAGDLAAMRALFDADATLHFGSLAAPGFDRAEISRGIDTLASRHRVESNTVTLLRAGTVDADTGIAELGCLTTTASSYGPVPSTWLLRVERGGDDRWRIRRLACIAVAGREPGTGLW